MLTDEFASATGSKEQMAPSRRPAIVCDVRAVRRPHVGTVGSLARLGLVARRLGFRLQVRESPRELRELLVFAGLAETLGVEPERQAEEREETLGVEEERELDDPVGG